MFFIRRLPWLKLLSLHTGLHGDATSILGRSNVAMLTFYIAYGLGVCSTVFSDFHKTTVLVTLRSDT